MLDYFLFSTFLRILDKIYSLKKAYPFDVSEDIESL